MDEDHYFPSLFSLYVHVEILIYAFLSLFNLYLSSKVFSRGEIGNILPLCSTICVKSGPSILFLSQLAGAGQGSLLDADCRFIMSVSAANTRMAP